MTPEQQIIAISGGSDRTLGFQVGEIVRHIHEPNTLVQIGRFFLENGQVMAEGPIISGRYKHKTYRGDLLNLRQEGGIVAKGGFRVGDYVRVDSTRRSSPRFRVKTVENPTFARIFRLYGDGRVALRDGDRVINCMLDQLTLIERDVLALDWMKQENWNLGERLERTTEQS